MTHKNTFKKLTYPTCLNHLDYLKPYFVGVFEGDGCIYVAQKHKKATIRLEIALKLLPNNVTMLQAFETNLGGKVYLNHQVGKVRWIAQSKFDVQAILQLFEHYPLLTSRKICQYAYAKRVQVNPDWLFHCDQKHVRYDNQRSIINQYDDLFIKPSYFSPWLSGFIEAEGHFGMSHDLLFQIGQNQDYYIIKAIQTEFESVHALLVKPTLKADINYYTITMYGPALKKVVAHCDTYPLIGAKRDSFNKLRNVLFKRG